MNWWVFATILTILSVIKSWRNQSKEKKKTDHLQLCGLIPRWPVVKIHINFVNIVFVIAMCQPLKQTNKQTNSSF